MKHSTEEVDRVLAPYLRDLDRSLLQENLKLTPEQRLEKLVRFTSFASELRESGIRARSEAQSGHDRPVR